METYARNKQFPKESFTNGRRTFLIKGILFVTLTGISGLSLVTSCNEEGTDEVSPIEDLMREHGILNRIMLIYDQCKQQLTNKEPYDLTILNNSAQVIRTFIEDYHEKLEEDYLFPRFAKANQLAGLVQLLSVQHAKGRKITDQIINLTTVNSLKNNVETQKLISLLHDFNWMYRPHEAWEDTVLFPELRKIVSKNEYNSLGEEFEEKEHKLFGNSGFEMMVEKVANIEKQLGIYDLSQFLPVI
jgi:hemerythrin-like domain-containing protein